mmetsp:Transcript_11690/g.20757  ORF Transcript_11690/g.20757 Transcript_11690/m.20757 type:complete len:325 (-) Transcript_11690:1097-2071(-)|eukprot:CAMPEP_0119107458 /NCGR_PEP_ID=MMETSP1180-20130426/10245_1 /TAXON_ID=3052 ORGANISM="Chlamydomonas cf sp, Strain CCMP681" /NCGR_SAMPLE_ID=MMETSP1180 /ASSEMBLY_ACC=CAM_ASM_000741 /LENGTH=324 /DNA_ID=CAMNT_0007092945 /DNA_START=63 /DNA_END=1037 /DNA_ORIENTATION=+
MRLGPLLGSQGLARTIAIGGHRGCGENLLSSISRTVEPQWRENTLTSFGQAAKQGVSFIEFDVQVTREGVPVIWHDDDVRISEFGSRKVKDLTLQQMQELHVENGPGAVNKLHRAFRSKQTRQPVPGYSPWLCRSDDYVPSLQQMFEALPESVAFNLEVKMAVPSDVERTPPQEVQRMLQPILQVVNRFCANSTRTLVFSSFDPDICIELQQMQTRFPVLFISGCGLYQHVDVRRTSIPAALQLAASNVLAGVVVPTSILMANKPMVQVATAQGLKVLTYGLENDDAACIEQQLDLGVHGAIVDDVERCLPSLMQAAALSLVSA